MKYTLAVTRQCNFGCAYCYISGISGHDAVMSPETAERIVEFIFSRTPEHENIDIGFFGGEPLLEFELIKSIMRRIYRHERYDPERFLFSVVTNGSIFSDAIAADLREFRISPGISCDGPACIQNRSRVFRDGSPTSAAVEGNIRHALEFFPFMPVNAVYSPDTLDMLPDVVEYFHALGVRNIYLNPDISARWTARHAEMLDGVFSRIGTLYLDYYKAGAPCHISLIDSKITVILRGGYEPLERCRMGKGEFAFAPSGNIYPCERLIGSDDGDRHCLGNVHSATGMLKRCSHDSEHTSNPFCLNCGISRYCMNWCGCTNYFATGDYNSPGAFICASEKASVTTAYALIEKLGEEGFSFADHLAGTPLQSIVGEVSGLQ